MWKQQEAHNGVLFLFESIENGEKLRLVTHIVFNERNSSEYTALVRGVAEDVEVSLERFTYTGGNNEGFIVIPLALIDSGMGPSTVFHLNPEAGRLLQFFTETEGYDLRPLLKVKQWYLRGY